MTQKHKLSLTTAISEMKKQKRARFALLAMVGHRKKEASRLQDEADFYSTTATEALAALEDAATLLAELGQQGSPEAMKGAVDLTSVRFRLARQLLNFWPTGTTSEDRLWKVLGSDGLATILEDTPEGYLSLSSTQWVNNVARAIEATKMLNQKRLSN